MYCLSNESLILLQEKLLWCKRSLWC